MEKKNQNTNYKVYIAFALVLLLTILLFPKKGEFKYKYQKGRPWLYESLISPIDFPILKSAAELENEKAKVGSSIIPYYSYDSRVFYEKNKDIENSKDFQKLPQDFSLNLMDLLREVYKTGILTEYDKSETRSDVIIVQKDRRATEISQDGVYDVNRASYKLRSELSDKYPELNVDSLLNSINIETYIVPNLLYDKGKTEVLHKEAVDFISPVEGMFYTGQLIVAKGEIVTEEIEKLLVSYQKEYESSVGSEESGWALLLGYGLYLTIIISILYVTIYFLDSTVYKYKNIYYFLLLLYTIIFIVSVYVGNYDQKMMYIVPYSVFALFMVSFFKQSSAISIYMVMLLPLTLLSSSGLELYLINLFSGMVGVYAFKYLNKGWHQFLNALLMYVAMVICFVAFRLISDDLLTSLSGQIIFYLAINAFAIIATYPLVYLFEKIFSLVSKSRLKDLADTNNKLLQELAKKAPGTFQHSLQVANLAAGAAEAIGADQLLVRVGALYHDIGKIENPQCFIENQLTGMDYHKHLTPFESAQQIIRHVDAGIEMAKKNKIPPVIIDFIRTHHARSFVNYFYTIYCNNGGDPENKEPFTYHGELPQTKEQAILLMADSVEAASRSLNDYSEKSISDFVDKMIASKMNEKQLNNSDISLKEVTIVKDRFKEHLRQVYHSRIAYPERKTEENK